MTIFLLCITERKEDRQTDRQTKKNNKVSEMIEAELI